MGKAHSLTEDQITAINWDLPRQQIAAELGISLSLLNTIRKQQGVAQTKFSPHPAATDWSSVDYTRKTRDLMEQYQKSRNWICRMRRKYGKEKS